MRQASSPGCRLIPVPSARTGKTHPQAPDWHEAFQVSALRRCSRVLHFLSRAETQPLETLAEIDSLSRDYLPLWLQHYDLPEIGIQWEDKHTLRAYLTSAPGYPVTRSG